MSLTPQDVRDQKFRERRKGYDVDEVDAFLERVTQELAALLDEREALRARAARSGEEPNELLARTLVTAQRAADDTLAEARAEADRMLDEARATAERTIAESEQQVAAERADLDVESERVARAAASLARFRDEYRGRVKAVIAEQLALLERAGELPDVPPAVAELAALGRAQQDDEAAQELAAPSALGPVPEDGPRVVPHAQVPPVSDVAPQPGARSI